MRVVIVGGGPAGFFASIACARSHRRGEVRILEKGPSCLSKVAISGGGRCNVTHRFTDISGFASNYPRGEEALPALLRRFGPRQTVAWFESHGVPLKTEKDGRMFPLTDRSASVVECLEREATAAGVVVSRRLGVAGIRRRERGGFSLALDDGSHRECDRVLLATGGCRSGSGGGLPVSLGHTLANPVPSLFSFDAAESWIRELAGVSVQHVGVSVPGTELSEHGPLLFTHRGFSGPAILRLSAWGARHLHALNYRFALRIGWLGEPVRTALDEARGRNLRRLVANAPAGGLPSRLWRRLIRHAAVPPDMRWNTMTRECRETLAEVVARTDVKIHGRCANKEEFVTCGGIPLSEVDLATMESRLCPGLYFAGELLDIDGITGGFNFQAAWTTGWIAGHAMAK